jgi:putative hydrolase
VIRGDDHVNNTPRQINLLKALGANVPQYAHLSMILGDDGQKLSKRHGAVSVMQYHEDGYLPEAVLNYLARLGWSHGDDEVFDMAQFCHWFDLDHITPSAAQFNTEKLNWLNAHYIKTADLSMLAKDITKRLAKQNVLVQPAPSINTVLALYRERSNNLNQLATDIAYFYKEPQANILDVEKHITDDIKPVLQVLYQRLANVDWTAELIQEAINIADLWINEATTFPSLPLTDSIALSRKDWIDSTLNGWQELTKPLVDSMSAALSSMLDQGLDGQGEDNGISIPGFGPMSISKSSINAIMATFMSSLISTQLGQSIGALSTTVTGANDVALPLSKDVKAQLLPQNVRAWGSGLEIQEGEIRIYLALREIAAARLFKQCPWLSGYIAEVISAYGSGIRIDISAITESAQDAMDSGAIDPSNPESMASALSGGLFTPETSPAQSAALEKLETLLALIEGWIDAVVVKAASDRLPSLIKLRESQVRRRATNSPTQQLFATLLGLEVSPRLTREAISFWEKLEKIDSISARDKIWEEAFLLPTASQLLDPEGFSQSRKIPDDLSGLI